MKKSIAIVIGIVLFGIVISISIYFLIPKNRSNYDAIMEASKHDYEIDISYSPNSSEEDGSAYFGNYIFSENKMKLVDELDQVQEVENNLYAFFANYLENKNYEEKEYTYVVSITDLFSLDPFYKSFIKGNSLAYICTYDFFENKILSVNCLNDNSDFTVDFYFD